MRLEIVEGDIVGQSVDAIVNAANCSLLGGGGVDGAIHAAAGPSLLAACRHVRATRYPDGLPVGEAVATPGGALAAAWVIHTVGPNRWEQPEGASELLASCHLRALAVADDLGAESIAFPAISCGAYGWTPAEAAPVALRAVRDYATGHPQSGVQLVRFVLFNDSALTAFEAARSALQ